MCVWGQLFIQKEKSDGAARVSLNPIFRHQQSWSPDLLRPCSARHGLSYSSDLGQFSSSSRKSSFCSKTYADMVASQLPLAQETNVEESSFLSKIGDVVCVKIDGAIYQERIALCKTSMIGRLIQLKGELPLKINDLKARLKDLWQPKVNWRIISLGKGYYNVHFVNREDRDRVWSSGSWNLKPGLLFLILTLNCCDPQTHKFGVVLQFRLGILARQNLK